VGTTTIEPGKETTVSTSMMMHSGMDGPHLFRVTVPIQNADGTKSELQLLVRANFR